MGYPHGRCTLANMDESSWTPVDEVAFNVERVRSFFATSETKSYEFRLSQVLRTVFSSEMLKA